jgi:glutamate transport system permease protein
MSAVLYDVPGPRARARNRILNVVVVLVLLGIVAWVVLKLNETGQFESRRWAQFQYKSSRKARRSATS